ncbi:hypothetical protein [Pelagovum pacificum]|uniref:Dihydroorotate dehydrogenase n=1 Tax=Pelagovum pacificum TaxID=2588711 RepID=A0A5C5GEP4_9RHOB|nr:hypothetical protein [Pelagovum pacificum]QQA43650.1 hypothetical protein I8N54_03485 [Pelagovum pacificum]TNY33215.1 hypothetical protein FHY64_08045 [Pelagovum pacificum]
MTEPLNDRQLDALFDTTRERGTMDAGEAFLARLSADAAAEMPRRMEAPPSRGAIGTIWAGIGGWAGFGGLAAATVAGLWIGIASPAGIADFTDSVLGETMTVSFDPTAALFETEEG